MYDAVAALLNLQPRGNAFSAGKPAMPNQPACFDDPSISA
jgi:hypothetical protein